MFRKSLIFALLVIPYGPAGAGDCPNAQSAKLGFVLQRQGTRAEVRPASDHFVHVLNLYPGGKRQDVIYYRGFFPVSRFDDTARSINIPVSDIRSVFPLTPASRKALTYAPAQPGKIGSLVSMELHVTGTEKIELGPCTYDVLVVRNRAMNAEGKLLSEQTDLYSPELGFILGKRYEEKGGTRTTVKYQAIGPLERTSPL